MPARLLLAALLALGMLGACAPSGEGAPETPPDAALAPGVGGPPPEGVAVETVRFTDGGGAELSAYLARPQGEGPHPVLVLFPEWWGVDDWIRENAQRFAGQGYVALAVDVYRGKVATDRDTAHELSRALPDERALADAAAGLGYVSGQPYADPQRVGVIGWCMGGGLALKMAAESDVDAVVVCYGRLFTSPEQVRSLPPLLGIFGSEDGGIPPEDVQAFEQLLEQAGVAREVHLYEGAGHAFMNPANQQGYDAAATEQAWAEIDAFLAQRLQGGEQ